MQSLLVVLEDTKIEALLPTQLPSSTVAKH